MTLDEICKRPGAGLALLQLQRWLLHHGSFALRSAFARSAMSPWLLQAGSDLSAFTVLAELGRIAARTREPEAMADRVLALLQDEAEFEYAREFLTLYAAVMLADTRMRVNGRGSLLGALESDQFVMAAQRFGQAAGLGNSFTLTWPDGRVVKGAL